MILRGHVKEGFKCFMPWGGVIQHFLRFSIRYISRSTIPKNQQVRTRAAKFSFAKNRGDLNMFLYVICKASGPPAVNCWLRLTRNNFADFPFAKLSRIFAKQSRGFFNFLEDFVWHTMQNFRFENLQIPSLYCKEQSPKGILFKKI